jgi:serine/threonine-protein kinase
MMEQSPFVLEPGALIAERYRLMRPLGSGGSAYVWSARDEALGREVAVKILSGSASQGGRERERLHREARLLALLEHPRITTVYDYMETVGPDQTCNPVLVTELVHGSDLRDRLEQGPLPPEAAFTVCAEVAEALAAAHRAGIVHRDVKPANVMMTERGAKLLDFGISRRDADTDLTGQVAIGTPACMAPEQWQGQPAQPASDVYALGCMLYWCLSGHAPYAEREMPALGVAHLTEEAPELPAGAHGNAAISELYRACTRKDPGNRPSAADAANVLRAALAAPMSAPVTAPATAPMTAPVTAPVTAPMSAPVRSRTYSTQVPMRSGRRHMPAAVMALAVAAVIGVGIAVPVLLAADDGSGPSLRGGNSDSFATASQSANHVPDATGSAGAVHVVSDLHPSGSQQAGPSRGPGSTASDPSDKPSQGAGNDSAQPQNSGGGAPTAAADSPSDQPSAAGPGQSSDPSAPSNPSSAATEGPTQAASQGAAPEALQ